MGVNSPFGTDQDPQLNGTMDPRLQPTPDYGNLGPGSDIARYGSPNPQASRRTAPRSLHFIAMAIGMGAAIIAGSIGKVSRGSHVSRGSNEPTEDSAQIDRMKAQRQAETLLEQAVAHSPGAVEQISARVNQWHGRVQWTSQIQSLTTAALNSDDMRVRESGVEVELAAYGLSKNSESLAYVLQNANSPDHAKKIWGLWALGLMANRGVEPNEAVETLKAHLDDADVDSRRWAVAGLALAATDDALASLLKTMHDDASPAVRENAACGVAQSGMFSHEQRMSAVPKLLEYSDDPALDSATHAWAFHALSDITHQHVPNDANAWRQWYQTARGQ